MRVSKWGDDLAVRLPAALVEALELKEGDEIEVRAAGERELEIARNRSREAAIERLKQMRWSIPPGFTFDREAANGSR